MIKFRNSRTSCTLIDIDQFKRIFVLNLPKFDHIVFDYMFTKHEFFLINIHFVNFAKNWCFFSKKTEDQLYVFTMFIDKIEINNHVIKTNNNELIQIWT